MERWCSACAGFVGSCGIPSVLLWPHIIGAYAILTRLGRRTGLINSDFSKLLFMPSIFSCCVRPFPFRVTCGTIWLVCFSLPTTIVSLARRWQPLLCRWGKMFWLFDFDWLEISKLQMLTVQTWTADRKVDSHSPKKGLDRWPKHRSLSNRR
jgi:hypothetical protein